MTVLLLKREGRLVASAVLLLFAIPAKAQYEIEFMAPPSWSDAESFGHAFMIISTPVGNGIKEDSYGFYSVGTKGVIIAPGVIKSEFTENPRRFSRISVSIRGPITVAQRREVLKLVAEWNEKYYSLPARNCIDFVHAVASCLGWRVPPRDRFESPATYLRRLKALNDETSRQ